MFILCVTLHSISFYVLFWILISIWFRIYIYTLELLVYQVWAIISEYFCLHVVCSYYFHYRYYFLLRLVGLLHLLSTSRSYSFLLCPFNIDPIRSMYLVYVYAWLVGYFEVLTCSRILGWFHTSSYETPQILSLGNFLTFGQIGVRYD